MGNQLKWVWESSAWQVTFAAAAGVEPLAEHMLPKSAGCTQNVQEGGGTWGLELGTTALQEAPYLWYKWFLHELLLEMG